MPPKAREAIELARRGEFARAILSGEAAARLAPDDGGLRLFVGMLHARRRDLNKAVPHLSRAAALLGGDPVPRLELARALIGTGRLDEAEAAVRGVADSAELIRLRALIAARRGDHAEAAGLARAAVARDPRDFESWGQLGEALLALGDGEDAIGALRQALALRPDLPGVRIRLAEALERSNRLGELDALIATFPAAGVRPAESALIRARLLHRRGDDKAALAAAAAAPRAGDSGGRAQLIGRISDRLGRHRAAFAAFAEMNRADGAGTPRARRAAREFRDQIALHSDTMSPSWYRSWVAADHVPTRPPPFFLFGFPRSGTTLIDTMLAGHCGLVIVEERPVLHAAAEKLGGIERLARLGTDEVAALRAAYFDALDREAPRAAGKSIVDKIPFGMLDAGLVHRLFPEARIVFAERHPCDVVLSGFMTRFDAKGGMANFLDLRELAALYDAAMTCWTRTREALALNVHNIRYERMIEDPEMELRALTHFLGLAWDPAMLDHVASAQRRGHIATPSYAQVAEPLYDRARGRWQHYREQLAPVLPVLAPWCEAMGYEV